jgi:2-polyprenyl-3-methyl-5-hydroxy-6-metoxy-1,4-benzoquinol methylase
MKKKCNICNKKFIDILSLGKHPCADTFLSTKLKAIKLKKYPLMVGYCNCSHLTSIYKVPSFQRYEKYDYSYTSDNSPVSRLHFKNVAKYISNRFKIDKNSFVVEAGSNDGTFLNEIKNISKANVLGVDPSKNISLLAKKKNINVLIDYFNTKSVKKIKKLYGSADIIYGANVFNHVDDNLSFLNAANYLLKEKGTLILEVPDLESLINKVGFDTIYHEHRHYYSEKSINKILKLKNFKIIKLDKIDYMAGSLRIFAKKISCKDKAVQKFSGVTHKDFLHFKKKIQHIIKDIKTFVFENIKNKNLVYGIGAATKGNTLLNCCEFNDQHIAFILDKSKFKINKFTPLSGIKIIKEDKNLKFKAALILPWNISNHIIKKVFKKRKILYTSIAKITNKIK